jgi:hypothetical protein
MPKTTKSTKAATKKRKTAVLEKTEEERKYLARVPEEFVFWNNDGSIFRDINELKEGLARMSDQTYAYHANAEKNDFTKWVRNIIGDEKLAKDLESATNREQAARIVDERYASLNTPAI